MINIEFIDRSPEIDFDPLSSWLLKVINKEDKRPGVITVVFGSDNWLLEKNTTFLNHDYYTDIITFDYSEDETISGDLLISLDRVNENADLHNVSRETELFRVVVHGVLHLIGYNDKNQKESKLMRKKEDYYLSLL